MADGRVLSLRGGVTVGMVCVLALVPIVGPGIGTTFYTTLFTRILIYSLAASGLNIVLGYGGLVSFGHSLYLALGAYVYAILSSYGLENGWLHVVVALTACTTLALLIGSVCLRTKGMAFIMITLAFAQMFYYVAVSLKAFGGDEGMSLPRRSHFWLLDLTNDTVFYYVVLACLVGTLLFVRRFASARFGTLIRASRTNSERLATLGFPLFRYQLASYVVSAWICVIAGVLLGNLTRFVSPSIAHWSVSGDLIVMVVLGGMGTVAGPTLGAIVLGLIEQFLPVLGAGFGGALDAALRSYWKLGLGLFIVSVALLMKRGLYGLLQTSQRVP